MRVVVGIDPSLRRTGICWLRGGKVEGWNEIQPEQPDLLSSFSHIEGHLHDLFWEWRVHEDEPPLFGVEKQLSVGGHTSSLMFAVQMLVLRVIKTNFPDVYIAHPLPIQLKSYIKKRTDIQGKATAGEIVRAAKASGDFVNYEGRFSQHVADAYFLAKLAEEALEGTFEYNLSKKEIPIHPWKLIGGKVQK